MLRGETGPSHLLARKETVLLDESLALDLAVQSFDFPYKYGSCCKKKKAKGLGFPSPILENLNRNSIKKKKANQSYRNKWRWKVMSDSGMSVSQESEREGYSVLLYFARL